MCSSLSIEIRVHISDFYYHSMFSFHSKDVVIHSEDEIRLKIVGTRVDASGIVSIRIITVDEHISVKCFFYAE